MAIDREKLQEIFGKLGQALKQPATLCLSGSAPGILLGQLDRNTSYVDVWRPNSDFEDTDFAAACTHAGLLFDPKGEVGDDDIYIQVVDPGIVALPSKFETQAIGRFGNLSVIIPAPSAIAASKLLRAAPQDIEDIAWWMRSRALTIQEIESAIIALPRAVDRETASENLVFVQLLERRHQ